MAIGSVITESDVSLTTSETTADADNPTRVFLSLQNNGSANIYVYYTAGGTSYYVVVPGATFADSSTNRDVYYKSASGTQTVHKIVVAQTGTPV